jgi:hypothetical protein
MAHLASKKANDIRGDDVAYREVPNVFAHSWALQIGEVLAFLDVESPAIQNLLAKQKRRHCSPFYAQSRLAVGFRLWATPVLEGPRLKTPIENSHQ